MKPKTSLLLAGAFTVLGLVVLLRLGFWQVERLEWKTGLLDQIDRNLAATPIPLPDGIAIEEWEYRRVCVEGAFLHEKEMHLFSANLAGQPGYHIYTPLRRDEGGALIINRGWVPDTHKDPATRAEGQGTGVVNVCGVLRASRDKGLFAPDNDPAENIWIRADAAEMTAAAGLENVLPFLMDADDAPNAGGYPAGGQTRIDIPNNHLGYAVTWFGLAAALLGVFTAFFFSRRRKAKN